MRNCGGGGWSPQWRANWCIACLFGATRCRVETTVTFAARFLWWRFHVGAKKFALLRCVIEKARKSSPSALKTPQIRRFCACWASFFAERPLEAPCWASFFAERPLEAPCWANFVAERPLKGPCWANFVAEWDRHGAVVCSKASSTLCHLSVCMAWWNAPSVAGFGQ